MYLTFIDRELELYFLRVSRKTFVFLFQRQVASSEEVMLACLWDSDEHQMLIREREKFKAGKSLI